jgi:omega-6 fatty acid desaturase (delta-12 desaturase)
MQQTIEVADRQAGERGLAAPDARQWVTALAPYRAPNLARSLAELVVTVVPFVALWLLMLASLRHGYSGSA